MTPHANLVLVAAELLRPFDRPEEHVRTRCGKLGQVITWGPEQAYVIADFHGLGLAHVQTPDQHARYLHHARTGEWPPTP